MFNLKRPCAQCPFRYDIKGYLTEDRVYEITDGLLAGGMFPCHKTVQHDDDGDWIPATKDEHCAGATIFLEHQDQPNQMMRISERLGLYDRRQMDMDAPVFDDQDVMAEHHAMVTERR